MEVYEILQQLERTQSKNEKEKILKDNKDNIDLKKCFELAYSPTINFYMKKELTYVSVEDRYTLTELFEHLNRISSREFTGNAAINFVQDSLMLTSNNNCEIVKRILQGDLRCGVGTSTINKVWKSLIVKPPRQGAKSMSEASLKVLENKRKAVELKSDGAYLAFNRDLMSRNGNPITVEPLELHLNCGAFEGYALEGEGIFDLTKATREEGNGVVGKIVKNTATNKEKDGLIYQIWDCIDVHNYKSKGEDLTPNYERRLILESMMENYLVFCNDQFLQPKVQLIPRTENVNMEEATIIFEDYVKAGFEGAILKDMDASWKDNGKPASCVKMKRKDPADLEIVGVYEGEGKAKGMLGGVTMESSEGIIKTNCGSGFSDDQRVYYWNNKNEILGKIGEVEYDSITQDKKTLQHSLFLPIFKKLRDDKLEADSYEEIKAKVKIK